MSEMTERVAKAIHKACSDEGIDTKGYEWDREAQSVRDCYAGIARAAVEAMREPTKEMTKAAYDHYGNDPVSFAEEWRFMIAAALKEP